MRFCSLRYKNLLARPTILRELVAERETLLAQLTAMVEAMDGEFETRLATSQGMTGSRKGAGSAAGLGPVGGKNTSSVVLNVVWVQSVKSKVSGVWWRNEPFDGSELVGYSFHIDWMYGRLTFLLPLYVCLLAILVLLGF